jgi:2-dehydropantoate 2-reductase
MRILVTGAGALGGYYGACLTRVGRDVTFLVRQRRSEQIARHGLRVISPNGDFAVTASTIRAGDIREPFDLVLVAVKSYSLNEAMEHFAPAVGSTTAILPIINGMGHLDSLSARFGAECVLGGVARVGGTLDDEGRVVHIEGNELVFGEIPGGFSDRSRALSALFQNSGFTARASEIILQDMWEKWVQLGTGASMTCMMRGTLGDILTAPGGREAILQLLDECCAIATAAGYEPRPTVIERLTAMVTTEGSPLKASMLRDIERGSVTEGEHILGDLAERARALGIATPILDLARIHVAAYERGREGHQTAP